MAQDYSLTTSYKGFSRKADPTNLPPGFMIVGSSNVLSSPQNRFGKRKGYTLDGQANNTSTGITTSYDFETTKGYERHIRVGNAKMQFRYKSDGASVWNGNTFINGEVYWIDMQTVVNEDFSFTKFYNTTELLNYALFVDGQSQIQEWNGAVTTIASNTATTLTKNGTSTWAEEGFNLSANKTININGTIFTYTGGETTTTLTGLVGLPAITANTVVFQNITTTLNSAMTGLPATLKNTNLGTLLNQVFVSASDRQEIYMSKRNNYKDYTFSAQRIEGEGGLMYIDTRNPFFITQEDVMYVSGGRDDWYTVDFETVTTSTTVVQTVAAKSLKTSPQLGAINRDAMFKARNDVVYLTYENTFTTLGRVDNILGTPQTENLSDPIEEEFAATDFTNASGIYYQYNLYIACPADSKVLIYNIEFNYWEAPQTLPISRFAIFDGELYGHSSGTPETFKLFEGSTDVGFPIKAAAYMAYDNYGYPARAKTFEDLYVEGYISGNTTLTVTAQYDIDGCATTASKSIDGSDSQVVCLTSSIPDSSSFGKSSLGKNPLGSTTGIVSSLPPKFRAILPYNQLDFYEVLIIFSSEGLDDDWQILRYGPAVEVSRYNNALIRK